MREVYRDIVYGLGLLVTSFTAYLAWRGPQPADPPAVQAVAAHPVGGLIVVAILFLLAGALNAAPLLSRLKLKGKARGDGPPKNDTPLVNQIFIHIPAVATAVIGDQASTRISFFSAQSVRLTYCKVKFVRGEASFTLDNPQGMDIAAFQVAEQKLERSLTTDEQERIGQAARGDILHYEGLAIFGNTEKPFWGMVVSHF